MQVPGLDEALVNDELSVAWGGLSERERRKLRRRLESMDSD